MILIGGGLIFFYFLAGAVVPLEDAIDEAGVNDVVWLPALFHGVGWFLLLLGFALGIRDGKQAQSPHAHRILSPNREILAGAILAGLGFVLLAFGPSMADVGSEASKAVAALGLFLFGLAFLIAGQGVLSELDIMAMRTGEAKSASSVGPWHLPIIGGLLVAAAATLDSFSNYVTIGNDPGKIYGMISLLLAAGFPVFIVGLGFSLKLLYAQENKQYALQEGQENPISFFFNIILVAAILLALGLLGDALTGFDIANPVFEPLNENETLNDYSGASGLLTATGFLLFSIAISLGFHKLISWEHAVESSQTSGGGDYAMDSLLLDPWADTKLPGGGQQTAGQQQRGYPQQQQQNARAPGFQQAQGQMQYQRPVVPPGVAPVQSQQPQQQQQQPQQQHPQQPWQGAQVQAPASSMGPQAPQVPRAQQIPSQVSCPKCKAVVPVNPANRGPDGKLHIQCPSCGVTGSI